MDHSLLRYTSRRVLQIPPLLVGITILSFFIFYLSPIDPVIAYLGLPTVQKMPIEDVEKIKEQLGLNQPIYIRYGIWLSHIATGDLGFSHIQHRPVLQVILEKFPATLLLTIPAYGMAMILAVLFSLAAAAREGSKFDRSMTGISYIMYATPSFLVALLLMLVFAVWLGWLPASRMASVIEPGTLLGVIVDHIRHLILPATALAVSHFAVFYGFLRSSLSESMREDYITTARAKGLDERTILNRHAFRNSLLPFITQIGLAIPYLIAGSVVIETIFAWPGIGALLMKAVSARDLVVIESTIMVIVLMFLLVNFAIDILYHLIDPRITYE